MNRLYMKYPQSVQEDSLAGFLKKLPHITKRFGPCEFINHIDALPEVPRHYIKANFQMNNQIASHRQSLPQVLDNYITPKSSRLEQLQSNSQSKIPLPIPSESIRRHKHAASDQIPEEYKGSLSSRASPQRRVIFKSKIQVLDCGNGMVSEQPINDQTLRKPIRRMRIKNLQTDFDQ